MTPEQKQRKAEYQKAYRNSDSYREASRKRMEAHRSTSAYQAYLIDSRENRKRLKAKYRADRGCVTREEIAANAEKKRAAAEQKRLARDEFKRSFIGAPSPKSAMTDAEYYKWRYSNDQWFMARELDRAQAWKVRTRSGYKASSLKWSDVPPVVMEVKRLMYVINQQLQRKTNENHQ